MKFLLITYLELFLCLCGESNFVSFVSLWRQTEAGDPAGRPYGFDLILGFRCGDKQKRATQRVAPTDSTCFWGFAVVKTETGDPVGRPYGFDVKWSLAV